MKDLVRTLSFLYHFTNLGRGKLSRGQLTEIGGTGRTLTENARRVLDDGQGFTQEEEIDLAQAALIEQHIIEITQWMLSQEVI